MSTNAGTSSNTYKPLANGGRSGAIGATAAAQAASSSRIISEAQKQLQSLLNGSMDVESLGLNDQVSILSTSSDSTSHPATLIGHAHGQRNGDAPNTEDNVEEAVFVQALYTYTGEDTNHLSFQKGDIIEVLGQEPSGWWDGVLVQSRHPDVGKRGWFPSNYVKPVAPPASASVQVTGSNHGNFAYNSQDGSASYISRGTVPLNADLDLLAGRRGADDNQNAIDRLLGSSILGDEDEDLTSFSTGGDIFSEIAAAAAASQGRMSYIEPNDRLYQSTNYPSESGSTQTKRDPKPPEDSPHIFGGGRHSKPEPLSSEKLDIDWIPKVSTDGRIFYYNTRTGDSALEIPSPSTSSNVSRHRHTDSGTNGSDLAPFISRSTSLSDFPQASASTSSLPGSVTLKALGSQSSSHQEFVSAPSTAEEVLSSHVSSLHSERLRDATLRPSSVYSDDSALDADLEPKRPSKATDFETTATPRKISIATVVGSAASAIPATSFDNSAARLTALKAIAALEPKRTLASLEHDCMEALSELSQAVQSRASVAPRQGETFDDAEKGDRNRLEIASQNANTVIRQLLAGTDVILEQPYSKRHSGRLSQDITERGSFDRSILRRSSTSSDIVRDMPALNASEFRPLAMKITATESKLVLSVRSNWGLLATSPAEEEIVSKSREADNLSDGDAAAAVRHRQQILTVRRDIDAKLRFDLLIQIRTLGEAISAFVDAIEQYANRKGLSAQKSHLAVPRRVEAEWNTTPAALLLPLSTVVGALKGHGFSARPSAAVSTSRPISVTPSSLHFPASVKNSAAQHSEPSKILTVSALSMLELERKTLVDDVNTLQTIFTTLLGSQVSSQTLKASLLPTVTAQIMQFVMRLGRFLKEVEDVDIASKVDIELDPETFAILVGESLPAVIKRGIFPLESDSSTDSRKYRRTLRLAVQLLQNLADAKQALYAHPSRALLLVQALSAISEPNLTTYEDADYIPPTQPSYASPLAASSLPEMQSTTLKSLLDCFSTVGDNSSRVISAMQALASLADEQAGVPSHLRRANMALRAAIVEANAPQSSLSVTSSVEIDRSERRGVGHLEDDLAEELESRTAGHTSGSAFGQHKYSARSSLDKASSSLYRMPSGQSSLFRAAQQNRSRAASVTESFVSEGSLNSSKRDAAEDLRVAMQDAGFGSPGSNHSPSKSKLKQFFGQEAPGQNIHRPPTANRELQSFLQADYPHDQISYASDGSVRAGTLHALVCRLTNHMSSDTNFNNVFLMTHRTFTNSTELLSRLQGRYYMEAPNDIRPEDYTLWVEQKQKLVRIRVVNTIRSWLTDYLYDNEDGLLLDKIAAFAATLPTESSRQLAGIIERRRETGAARRLTASVSGGPTPPPIVPRNLKKIKFLDVDPLEIARQLTVVDSRLFGRITAEECLSKAWPKKFHRDMPNFKAIADQSNLVTSWVAMSIVLQPDVRRRAAIIKHFVSVADKCRQLSNFTALMQIIAGLNCSAIYRLKRTWELVNQRTMSTLTFLGNLMSPENNHALYRDALRLVGSPCVPFLGVYFTDWVMSGEANSDMLRDKPDQINFAKRARVAESIQQIQLHQTTPYNLAPVPALLKWLEEELQIARLAATDGQVAPGAELPSNMDPMQKAYELSLKIEPREREDERSENTVVA